jgi:hypothetical protein
MRKICCLHLHGRKEIYRRSRHKIPPKCSYELNCEGDVVGQIIDYMTAPLLSLPSILSDYSQMSAPLLSLPHILSDYSTISAPLLSLPSILSDYSLMSAP